MHAPRRGLRTILFQRPRDGVTGNPGQSIRVEKWADYQTNVGEEEFTKSKTLFTIKTRLFPQTRQHEVGLSVNLTQVNPVGGNSAAYLSAYRGRSDAGYGFGPDGNPVPSNDANPPARVMGRNGTVTNWGSHGDVYPLVVEGRDYVRNPSQGAAAAEFDLWAIGEDRNKKRGGINMVLGPIPGVNDAHPQPAGYIVPQFDYGVQVGAQHGIRNFANVGYAYHVGAGIYSNLLGSRANSDQISVVNGVDLRNISLTGRRLRPTTSRWTARATSTRTPSARAAPPARPARPARWCSRSSSSRTASSPSANSSGCASCSVALTGQRAPAHDLALYFSPRTRDRDGWRSLLERVMN